MLFHELSKGLEMFGFTQMFYAICVCAAAVLNSD